MKTLFIFFFLATLASAGTLWISKTTGIEYNDKYSFKDFSDKKFTDAKDIKNTIIVGSCFYQQAGPDTKVFPDTMTGVTFIRCNLDNVFIPDGNKVLDGTKKRIMQFDETIIEDGKEKMIKKDWMVDKNNAKVKRMEDTTGDDNEKATAADFSVIDK